MACGYLDVVDAAGLGECCGELSGGEGVGQVAYVDSPGLLSQRRPGSRRIVTANCLDLGFCLLSLCLRVLLSFLLLLRVIFSIGRELFAGSGRGVEENGVAANLGGEKAEADAVLLDALEAEVVRSERDAIGDGGGWGGTEERAEGGDSGGHGRGSGRSEEVGGVVCQCPAAAPA